MRRFGVRLALLSILASPAIFAYAQPEPKVLVEHNIEMKARDGITLRADIYRPAGEEKLPVLLQRTPYNKNNTAEFAHSAAQRGYLVVVQDVRGRFASDGDWYPFKSESNDGYDTVEWAATLPRSNGKIGMFGGSYVGATQMLAAVAHPPHLAGICPVVTASNYHENWTYQGGAFEQWFNESWTSGLAQDTLDRVVRGGTNALQGSSVLPLKDYPLFNLKLPSTANEVTHELAPYFQDWLDHPLYDDYWKQWAIDERYSSIQVPALTVTAWYDIFQGGSLRNFEGLKSHAGNEEARTKQRLLITIGGHAGGGRTIGSVDFGHAAEEYDEFTTTLEWYDYLLKGKQNGLASQKPVKIFVMGTNQWREEDNWPLARAKQTRYFLHSNGKANTASGSGALATNSAMSDPVDSYTYDPLNPVPTVGGPLCCDAQHLRPGPLDQRSVEERPDVLVYSTQPLEEATEVTGPVSLELYARSTTVNTDFTAKLVDVAPNGTAINLTEGILRASHRASMKESIPIKPGEALKYTVDLWSTSNVFAKGHKIRVEVSSSNFPRFDRNLNTGVSASVDKKAVKSLNTIYHDAEHPSALLLPIVPATTKQ